MKLSSLLLSLSLTIICSAACAEDFLSAGGLKITTGQSQRFLESKLGIPEEENSGFVRWKLKNGNRLTANFDQYGLSNAILSGSATTDYLLIDGLKIFLGKESINSIEKKLKSGCYYEGWGEGAMADYVVRSGPEGSINLMFSTWGGDLTTKILKSQKVASISLGDDEPLGEQKYCHD